MRVGQLYTSSMPSRILPKAPGLGDAKVARNLDLFHDLVLGLLDNLDKSI
jgi:hypothetical protein